MSVLTIVDDNDELRSLLSLLLKQELGVDCLCMASLADVLHHSNDVLGSDVALLDINLGYGEPDGVAVYDWLRAHEYRGNIFFLTGHAQSSPQVQRAAETGARVLEKPMTADEMILVLRDYVTGMKRLRNAGA